MTSILDPPPREPTLEQHMIEFGKVTAASLNNAIGPNKKYLILQGNKVAQIFIKNAFEFFEKHFPNKNPHILTARCLQINVTAVRRFKNGPTEKTICQKPYTKKPKINESASKQKEPKNKKKTESKRKEDKLVSHENPLSLPAKPSCIQQDVGYQPNKGTLPEQNSFVVQENIEYNSLQVPIFPLPSQNNPYIYTSGKNMNYPEGDNTVNTVGTLPKPSVSDLFHLSPEPQYGAPSVAIAPNINQKNNLTDPIQAPTNNFEDKPFVNQTTRYQYPHLNISNTDNADGKVQCNGILQKQYEEIKFNFGNLQSNQSGYKY